MIWAYSFAQKRKEKEKKRRDFALLKSIFLRLWFLSNAIGDFTKKQNKTKTKTKFGKGIRS